MQKINNKMVSSYQLFSAFMHLIVWNESLLVSVNLGNESELEGLTWIKFVLGYIIKPFVILNFDRNDLWFTRISIFRTIWPNLMRQLSSFPYKNLFKTVSNIYDGTWNF